MPTEERRAVCMFDKIFLSKCECVTRLAGLLFSSINQLCLAEENFIFGIKLLLGFDEV